MPVPEAAPTTVVAVAPEAEVQIPTTTAEPFLFVSESAEDVLPSTSLDEAVAELATAAEAVVSEPVVRSESESVHEPSDDASDDESHPA